MTCVGRIVFAPTNDKNKSEEESAANAFSTVIIDATKTTDKYVCLSFY